MKKQSSLNLIIKIIVLVGVMVAAVSLIMGFVSDVNDTIDGFGNHGTTPTVSTTTATTIPPSECQNHDYDSFGICTKCGTVCGHSEQVVTENGNTYCSECGKLYALKKPVLSVNAALISWDPISDATEYIININHAKYRTINTSYEFTSEQAGEFIITVQAVSGSMVSEKSDSYTFRFYNVLLSPDDQGQIEMSSFVVREGDSCSGTVYPKNGHMLPDQIHITMGGIVLTSGYTYDPDTGEFVIENVTGEIYITYDAVSGVPAAPVLTLNGTVVSWNAVSGATDYHIRILGKDTEEYFDEYYPTTATSFDLANVDLTEGDSYYVSVWCDSEYGFGDSAMLVYSHQQGTTGLSAPVLTLNGSVLSWNAVSGADFYTIYVEGTKKTGSFRMTENCTFNLSTYVDDLVEYGDGTYHIWLKASGEGYSDSAESNIITYTVSSSGNTVLKLVTPVIKLV